MILGRLGL